MIFKYILLHLFTLVVFDDVKTPIWFGEHNSSTDICVKFCLLSSTYMRGIFSIDLKKKIYLLWPYCNSSVRTIFSCFLQSLSFYSTHLVFFIWKITQIFTWLNNIFSKANHYKTHIDRNHINLEKYYLVNC